jgi:hypothetical protein
MTCYHNLMLLIVSYLRRQRYEISLTYANILTLFKKKVLVLSQIILYYNDVNLRAGRTSITLCVEDSHLDMGIIKERWLSSRTTTAWNEHSNQPFRWLLSICGQR